MVRDRIRDWTSIVGDFFGMNAFDDVNTTGLLPVPRFENEAQERAFWESHDSADYVDWSRAERARFPNLKPSSKAISLRVPLALLERIKVEANRRDVPYQSLIKVWLDEKVASLSSSDPHLSSTTQPFGSGASMGGDGG